MDKLLQEAKRLAQQSARESYLPIKGRIAYVVSHGQSYTTNDDTALTQNIAHALNTHGFDTLCFVQPGHPWSLNIGSNIAPEVRIDGVRYIHTRRETSPQTEQEHLEAAVQKLEQIFLVYRPEIVLGDSGFMNGLPALVLAKRLGLPFYWGARDFSGLRENGNLENFQTNIERNIFIAQQADRAFVVNSDVKNWLTQSGADEKKIDLLFTDFSNSLLTNSVVNILKGNIAVCTESHIQLPPVSAAKTDQPSSSADTVIEPLTFTLSKNGRFHIGEISVPIAGATLEISASVVYRLRKEGLTRKAVMLFDFLNASGKRIETIPNVGMSAAFKQHFKYLNANKKSVNDPVEEVFNFQLPNEVVRIRVDVSSLGLADDEFIDIRIQGRCYDERVEKERKRQLLKKQPLPKAVVHDPKAKRYTSDLTIPCILDELTAECLSHEVNLVKVTQEGWRAQLENCNPDFLLVESCWRGNDGNWGTLTKGSGGSKKLSELLSYCKKNHIPTVFWNKEDPPHYEKFGPIAALFEVVITTDINMVPNYKKDFGITAYPLSFAAQPKIHNPAIEVVRQSKAVFAGSYYSEREARCNDFHNIVADLESVGIGYDIYDRNHVSGIERFQYPDRYAANIIGKLPPEELWRVNNGYKYQINLNSVVDSSTMFARRVYESLASGTPVISNSSKGVSELFGDLVIMNDSAGSISDKLIALEDNSEKYNNLAKSGVRRIMREHTYSHRIKEICALIGIDIALDQPEVTMIASASNFDDVEKAKSIFLAQTYTNKKLFVSLEKFTGAHIFLNQSDEKINYAMSLGRGFYDTDEKFYLSNRFVCLDLRKSISNEHLEDSVYWGNLDD